VDKGNLIQTLSHIVILCMIQKREISLILNDSQIEMGIKIYINFYLNVAINN